MKKKIRDLTDDEILNILGDDICKYCPYESIETRDGGTCDCPKGIVNYAGEPCFPRCVEDESVNKEIINNFKNSVDLDQEIEVEEYE